MIKRFDASLLVEQCNCVRFASRAINENALLSAPVITRQLMTATQSSRITLADLIPLIEKANLSPIQKRDLISAVRTVTRLLGAMPDEIDADPAKLRRRLETIAWGAEGLSKGRWNNVRSLFGKALALARPVMPGRRVARLLPEWEALLPTATRSTMIGCAPSPNRPGTRSSGRGTLVGERSPTGRISRSPGQIAEKPTRDPGRTSPRHSRRTSTLSSFASPAPT